MCQVQQDSTANTNVVRSMMGISNKAPQLGLPEFNQSTLKAKMR